MRAVVICDCQITKLVLFWVEKEQLRNSALVIAAGVGCELKPL